MTVQLNLSQRHISDINTIQSIDAETLQSVLVHLKKLNPLPLQPEVLHQEIVKVLGQESGNEADCLLRVLLALYQISKYRELNPDEVIEGLSNALQKDNSNWNKSGIESWNKIKQHLQQLFQEDAIRAVSKAIDLNYVYANLFQSARVLTDIRPVFNDDSDDLQIDGTVIAFALRLNYDNRDGKHSISIALDESDIRSLKNQCERALKKSSIAKCKMINDANIPTIVWGAAKHESDSNK